MPDFTLKPTFPMASVIDAAQRKAQLEQQFKTNANQQLVQGLDAIGQVGQSLVDKRMKVAQALALKNTLLPKMSDDMAKNMDPEQVIKAATIQSGFGSPLYYLLGKNPGLIHDQTFLAALAGGGGSQTPPIVPASTSQDPIPQPTPSNGAMLTSNVTATPVPEAVPTQSLTSQPTGSMPVPIAAPPITPPPAANPFGNFLNQPMTKGQMASLKMGQANGQERVMSKEKALAAGSVPKGTKIVEPTGEKTDKKEQDAYWRDAVRGLQSIRGDTAMKDIEINRNAAIQAYNRLKSIELTGKSPNPIDYIDILGQVYKARTGTAPTQEVLKEAKQNTAQGQFGKYWTYFTGGQMPGTSKEIASSLKDMVAHMGLQADELHDGYMQVHGSQVFNPNMNEDNAKKLSKLSRGKSFSDSTGVKAEDFDVHLQAIKWAQANPNDPRSQAILQKALQEKSATSGGTIGL